MSSSRPSRGGFGARRGGSSASDTGVKGHCASWTAIHSLGGQPASWCYAGRHGTDSGMEKMRTRLMRDIRETGRFRGFAFVEFTSRGPRIQWQTLWRQTFGCCSCGWDQTSGNRSHAKDRKGVGGGRGISGDWRSRDQPAPNDRSEDIGEEQPGCWLWQFAVLIPQPRNWRGTSKLKKEICPSKIPARSGVCVDLREKHESTRPIEFWFVHSVWYLKASALHDTILPNNTLFCWCTSCVAEKSINCEICKQSNEKRFAQTKKPHNLAVTVYSCMHCKMTFSSINTLTSLHRPLMLCSFSRMVNCSCDVV